MQVCQFVIRDLDQYGICVIDNFLGVERGDLVLQSVQAMYDSGVFREGETVSNKPKITGNIRGDKIAWVDGTEPHCQPISYLIRMVDSVVMNASRLNNNGKLGQHQISDRTKVNIFQKLFHPPEIVVVPRHGPSCFSHVVHHAPLVGHVA